MKNFDGSGGSRAEQKVQLGPANPPKRLTDALSEVLSSRRDVQAAYIAECLWPSGEKHLMVGIETNADYQSQECLSFAQEASELARPSQGFLRLMRALCESRKRPGRRAS